MLVLEGKCPKCFGNLILGEEEMSLTCEDCGYLEVTKDRKAFYAALEEAEEWGPKEKRLVPSGVGKLLLDPYSGLAEYLRMTLKEGMRGLELEEVEMRKLVGWRLIEHDD